MVGVSKTAIHTGRQGGVESVRYLPAVGHPVSISVPTVGVLVEVAVTVVVIRATHRISVTVGVGSIHQSIAVVVQSVVADVSRRILVAQDDGRTVSVGSGIAAARLVDLHGVLLVPVTHWHGAVPPDAVIEYVGGVRVVPVGGLEVGVLLQVGHAVSILVSAGTVDGQRGPVGRVKSILPFPAIGKSVVVGVPVLALSTDEIFDPTGQAISILIGRRHRLVGGELQSNEAGEQHQQCERQRACAGAHERSPFGRFNGASVQ